MKTGLLHPYPGSKKDWHKYPVWDERRYDAVIEPFVGAGHFTHRMLAKGVVKDAFISDIDPAVTTVWRAWMETEPDEFGFWDGECGREYIQGFIQALCKNIALDKALDNSIDVYFNELKLWLESGYDSEPQQLAAASIILRKLVFGGVLRCNTKGKLNVALSQDKLDQFASWQFEWPHFDEAWRLSVSDSWQNCIKRFEESGFQSAIAFVDPPYWLPPKSRPGRLGTGAMTPAYTHHGDPQGKELFDGFMLCLTKLLDNPRVSRVVFTNYVSDPLCFEIDRLLEKRKRQWWFTPLGTLATMNNGVSRDDCPIEGFWEFGGKRMAGRYEQKSLLEVAA